MVKQKKSIIFFGTSKFASQILDDFIKQNPANLQITNVITQPDKPQGRKKTTIPTPVKTIAQKYNIPIWQPEKLDKKFSQTYKELRPDIALVVAYGKIIPQNILDIPRLDSINIHGSILPKYRGASPIHESLINDESSTGITIMKMDDKMDHGPILTTNKVAINPDDDIDSLSEKLIKATNEILIPTIEKYLNNQITLQKQNHDEATFTKLISKEDGLIYNQSADKIYNMFRAYKNWPGVFIHHPIKNQPNTIKLLDISPALETKPLGEMFQLFTIDKKLFLHCADSTSLEIHSLQLAGKNPMNAVSFINGYLK